MLITFLKHGNNSPAACIAAERLSVQCTLWHPNLYMDDFMIILSRFLFSICCRSYCTFPRDIIKKVNVFSEYFIYTRLCIFQVKSMDEQNIRFWNAMCSWHLRDSWYLCMKLYTRLQTFGLFFIFLFKKIIQQIKLLQRSHPSSLEPPPERTSLMTNLKKRDLFISVSYRHF